MADPGMDFYEKAKQMKDQAAADENKSSDEDVLAEWQKATAALHAKAPGSWFDLHPAPGEPLADPVIPRKIKTPANPAGYSASEQSNYRVPQGSALDTQPMLRAAGEKPEEADGYALLERPFSALVSDLHDAKGTPEYNRVKELYGPARLAYMNKQRADASKK